jgi:hypothetical protein
MSLENFVEKSFDNFISNHYYDTSLALACSAVDATAKKVFPLEKDNNKRIKAFIKKYYRIISKYGFPGIISSGLKIKCTILKDPKTDENDMVDIEEIIYKTIRCGLLHECEIDSKLNFVEQTLIGEKDGKFNIPKYIVIGLLMSVVLCELNNNLKLTNDITFSINNEIFQINKLWGDEKNIET